MRPTAYIFFLNFYKVLVIEVSNYVRPRKIFDDLVGNSQMILRWEGVL